MIFSAIIPQDLRTTAGPTFGGLTLNGNLVMGNFTLYEDAVDPYLIISGGSYIFIEDAILQINEGVTVGIDNYGIVGAGDGVQVWAFSTSESAKCYASDFVTNSCVPDINDGIRALDQLDNISQWINADGTVAYSNHYACVNYQVGDTPRQGLSADTRIAQLEKMVWELNNEIQLLKAGQ
jgi:hypothetical protein